MLPLVVGAGTGRAGVIEFVGAGEAVAVTEVADVGQADGRVGVVVGPVVFGSVGLEAGYLEVEVIGAGGDHAVIVDGVAAG